MTGFGLAAYGALCAAAAGPAQAGPLTIDQAVAIAQGRAFAVRLQQSGVLRANAVVSQADAALGPSITLSGSYSRAGQAFFNNIGGQQVLFSPIDQGSVQVQLAVPIDLSGGLHASRRQADALRRAQIQTLNSALNDAKLNARTAFLSVLRSQATVEVQQQSLKNAEAQAEQARLQFEQKQVAKIDVDRLNAAVVQRRSDLIEAQNSLANAIYTLNLNLARPIDTPVEATDIQAVPNDPPAASQLDEAARAMRPESLAARERVVAQENVRRAAERLILPNLNLTLTQSRAIGQLGFSGQPTQSSLGLNFSVPIYDSGNIRSRVNQAKQDEIQAKITLEQTELGISQEVRAAVTTLSNAKARLANAIEQVALSEEVFRIAKVRQSAGSGTYVDIIDAETTLTTARTNLVSARYDVLTAYSQLQRAVGNDQLSTTITPNPSAQTGGASKQ